MSSGLAYVRFTDGLIASTVYHGTSDVLHPELTPWNVWPRIVSSRVQPLVFPVEIYACYGGGFWWEGLATRTEVLDDYLMPYGAENRDGSYAFPPLPLHGDQPEWVVAHNLDPR